MAKVIAEKRVDHLFATLKVVPIGGGGYAVKLVYDNNGGEKGLNRLYAIVEKLKTKQEALDRMEATYNRFIKVARECGAIE